MGDKIKGERNPVVALLLNIFLFCVGYFYIGQWKKGLLWLVFLLVLWWGPGWIAWIVGIIDVYMQATILQKGKSIEHWTFFSKKH